MPLVKGIGKPDEGEPHVRIDGGALETGQPGRPSAGPGPVCWKMPPQWPGRDPACWILVPAPALYPTQSHPVSQSVQGTGPMAETAPATGEVERVEAAQSPLSESPCLRSESKPGNKCGWERERVLAAVSIPTPNNCHG